jgi:hypothetical protein
MHLSAEASFRPDAEAIADEQHPDHQLRIKRWSPDRTVEGSEFPPQTIELDEPVDGSEKVICRHVPSSENS